jgi:hypothetical protein
LKNIQKRRNRQTEFELNYTEKLSDETGPPPASLLHIPTRGVPTILHP